MMHRTVVLCLVLSALAFSVASAQYPLGAAGLSWSGSSGQTGGNPCFGFSATAFPVTVTGGELVTVHLTGDLNAPYILALGLTATSYVPVNGIANALLLDQPAQIFSVGYLSTASFALACPPGTQDLTGVFPVSIPAGQTLALQAFTYGAGGVPTFTSAIAITVI